MMLTLALLTYVVLRASLSPMCASFMYHVHALDSPIYKTAHAFYGLQHHNKIQVIEHMGLPLCCTCSLLVIDTLPFSAFPIRRLCTAAKSWQPVLCIQVNKFPKRILITPCMTQAITRGSGHVGLRSTTLCTITRLGHQLSSSKTAIT